MKQLSEFDGPLCVPTEREFKSKMRVPLWLWPIIWIQAVCIWLADQWRDFSGGRRVG